MSQASMPPTAALARLAEELERLIYSSAHADDLEEDWHGYAGRAIGELRAAVDTALVLERRCPNREPVAT